MLRTMVTLLISFICLTVGVTQGQVIVSPVFRRASQCIGSLQIYKVTRPAGFDIIGKIDFKIFRTIPLIKVS